MPNERLAEALDRAGLSRKALARRIQELSTRRGRPIGCDHTSVSRWIGGTTPRDDTARLIAEVLTDAIGQTVSLADIGLTGAQSIGSRTGLEYGESSMQGITVLETLWNADIDQSRALGETQPDSRAWSEATLKWLLRSESTDTRRDPKGDAGGNIGTGDVDALRATVTAFSGLDDAFGGGRARSALIQYLRTDLAAMLNGRFTDRIRPELFSAAAEATLLAAWMSYDAGVHGVAQRYFIQALNLSDFADNQLLGGSILDAMSHQATYLGRSAEAVNLARAARSGTRGIATAGVTAHFHAMEARGLAVGGDSTGASKALNSAVRVFEKREPGADPDWIGYFDDAELSAEFSHCFRDLGHHTEAFTYSERAVSGTSVRSDFFVKMVGATSQLGDPGSSKSDLESACAIAAQAVTAASQLKSARSLKYLTDFKQQLVPLGLPAAVRDLNESMEGNPLWEAAMV